MNFGDFETRSRISNAVPKDTVNHALNMTDQTRRTEKSAAWKSPTRERNSTGAADMIDMGMADENVADLMSYTCGNLPNRPDQTKGYVACWCSSQMQQRVAEDPIDQRRVHAPHFDRRRGPAVVITRRIGHRSAAAGIAGCRRQTTRR